VDDFAVNSLRIVSNPEVGQKRHSGNLASFGPITRSGSYRAPSPLLGSQNSLRIVAHLESIHSIRNFPRALPAPIAFRQRNSPRRPPSTPLPRQTLCQTIPAALQKSIFHHRNNSPSGPQKTKTTLST
jgi:hypothetical protein